MHNRDSLDASGPETDNDSPAHDALFPALLESLLDRAAALAPILEAEAEPSEQAATLTPKSVAALRESGLLASFLPRELGGFELEPVAALTLVEEIARQDGSAGWCFGMNGFITGICSAALPDAGIDRIYGHAPGTVLMAGGFPPQGRADREGDGWRVSGHFRFGSGIRHTDYVVCTVVEFDGEAPRMDGARPRMRTFVVPRDEVRITDNWSVSGLEGTGSCDYHLDAQWLPDDMSFVSSTITPLRGATLYGIPLATIAGAPHVGFALGVGKRAIEEIGTHAGWRQRLASPSPLAQRGAFQQGFGRARTQLLGARAFVVESFNNVAAAHRAGSENAVEARANAYAATVHTYESAMAAAQFAFRAAGAGALFRTNRLQRCLRDIEAGSQHILASEEGWERVARYWLGLEEPVMF
jgi:alkylation response protein AidB-like acyl-CoA dehydrogenase